jgi:catechol 2,3-dioxygenase-like lactoylglutathione lyase family enzyme
MTRASSLLAATIVCAVMPVVGWGATPGSLAALSTQPSMNVFRRFAVDKAKMIEFYGEVLGLRAMPPIRLGPDSEMIRFQVGTAEIKLQATAAAAKFPNGAVRDVTGLRLFTFFFPDELALSARFTAKGLPAPEFRARAAGGRVAMVRDPEQQWVELVVLPGAPAATFDNMEVGLTVSDLAKSRAFYRAFVGLEELPPVDDPQLNTTRYPFRHGTMTVNVWAFGVPEAKNTSSAGIQYVITNVDAVDAKAKAESVQIDRPLSPFGTGLRTIWLSDPDGITNYFAQIVPRAGGAARPATQP